MTVSWTFVPWQMQLPSLGAQLKNAHSEPKVEGTASQDGEQKSDASTVHS